MITTMNIGSVKSTPWLRYPTKVSQSKNPTTAMASTTAQMPKIASTSPRKWNSSAPWLTEFRGASPEATRCSCASFQRCAIARNFDDRKVCRIASTKMMVATALKGSASTRWVRRAPMLSI